MLRNISAALAAACLLSGCASLLPDYAGPVLTHESHISQHAPFAADPTNYGSEVLGVTAIWTKPDGGPFVEITDGVTLGPQWTVPGAAGYGEVLGPRESFSATLGYLFKVPHG
jgi:hypothetical protein